VGESGSGKSTLGRLMLRLMEPTSGGVVLHDRDILAMRSSALRDMRSRMQIILQNPDSSLNPRKTVGEIIGRAAVRFQGLKGPELERRIVKLLDTVGLPSAYLHRYPHQLSGGEKQRVGIARALVPSPDLIVCDEAVSALDVSLQAAILNLLLDLRDEMGVAYMFISHDLAATSFVSDRIVVMNKGRIVEMGSTKEILQPPYHPYTLKLLSAAPNFDPGPAPTPGGTAAAPQGLADRSSGHWISSDHELA